MADLKKHATGVTHNVIASGIVEVLKWGWKLWGPIVTALIVTIWAYVKGQPGWVLALIAIGVFFFMSLTLNALVGIFTKSKEPQAAAAVLPPPSLTLSQKATNAPHSEFNPQSEINPTFKQKVVVKAGQKNKQAQEQQRARAAVRPTPKITAEDTLFPRHYFDRSERIILDDEEYHGSGLELTDDWSSIGPGPALALVKVALVRFYYFPDPDVEPFLEVTAHIFFDNTIGATKKLYDTVWYKANVNQSPSHQAKITC